MHCCPAGRPVVNAASFTPDEPIAAIATALAPAAIGVIRASGSRCIDLVSAVFSRPEALMNAEGNTLVYGWIIDPAAAPPRRLDEVLIAVFRSPRSYTGEDSVEISCHGGPAVVQAVWKLLLNHGFRAAGPGEFTFRSFIHGKSDLTRAEAVREIIDSHTDEARDHAANRLAGSLSSELYRIRDSIRQALAAIGAEIEYPEDEETTKGAFDRALVQSARDSLAVLEAAWQTERLYRDGCRIVLAGRTNAGKSSLFNLLLKEDRSIVSDTHGTTRDWLESWMDFKGLPVRLYDTAGLRMTDDHIEAQGVSRSRILAEAADLVMYVVDAQEGLCRDDTDFLSGSSVPAILVWNKCDIPNALPPPRDGPPTAGLTSCPVQAVSAKTAQGLDALIHLAVEQMTGKKDGSGTAGIQRSKTAPGSRRQAASIKNARESLEQALRSEEAGYPLDAVVQDLEDALGALAAITGETTTEDILDLVFSGFCVGK